MTSINTNRIFFFTISFYLLAVAVVQAAGTGASIEELTGGATRIFEALRDADFISSVGAVVFGLILLGMSFGLIGAGVVPIMMCLIGLGAWFGAESIVDTIYTSAAIL